MKHIILIGDSIFDNAGYVGEGESVTDILKSVVGNECKVTLLAVDGDVTTDVPVQLKSYPNDTTHAFISCGGNDALRQVNILNEKVTSVGEAMEIISEVIKQFQNNYQVMLKSVLSKNKNVALCTVYNSVPGISERAFRVLALFNEIILSEAVKYKLPVIDLRILCTESSDFSEISPIEPSGKGASKIAYKIKYLVNNHEYGSCETKIYA